MQPAFGSLSGGWGACGSTRPVSASRQAAIHQVMCVRVCGGGGVRTRGMGGGMRVDGDTVL